MIDNVLILKIKPLGNRVVEKIFGTSNLMSIINSMDLYRALLICFAVAVPITIGAYTNYLDEGLAIAYGAFWCSPSDVNGSMRHLRNGLLISAILVTLVSLVIGFLPDNNWIITPIIGVLMFFLSYLSIFGFRASLISFSGMFALVLSFSFRDESLHPIIHSLLVGVGGLWYLILAMGWYRLIHKKPIDETLNETILVTAEYIRTRSELVYPDTEREALLKKLFEHQVKLGELHESLREMLMTKRQSFGKSGYYRRRMLILIELVDIFELAMAHPVNYAHMDELFRHDKKPIVAFQKLLMGMYQQLHYIGTEKNLDKNCESKVDMQQELLEIKEEIKAFAQREQSTDEGVIILQNYYQYQKQQVEFIDKIRWILNNYNIHEMSSMSPSNARKFITRSEINTDVFIDNFSFKNTIFKHSLRLAVIAMIGFVIGTQFKLQNPYWILLTIIVILRPNYGLTKTRAKARIVGTIIGGIIAFAVVYFFHSQLLYIILSFITLIASFVMFKHNYQTAAAFVTLNVVFIYAMLVPNLWHVIQFRILDTAIGAALSTLGFLFLWPTWEKHTIKSVIAKSIKANQVFLKEIASYYEQKGTLPFSFVLARKRAFLTVSELSAAFQRMSQEPHLNKEDYRHVYAFVSLNQSFLSGLASLSTFIQNQPTTAISDNFKLAITNIEDNLIHCTALLEGDKPSDEEQNLSYFLHEIKTPDLLKANRNTNKLNHIEDDELLEAHLIVGQLKWLFSLSKQMRKRVYEMNFED